METQLQASLEIFEVEVQKAGWSVHNNRKSFFTADALTSIVGKHTDNITDSLDNCSVPCKCLSEPWQRESSIIYVAVISRDRRFFPRRRNFNTAEPSWRQPRYPPSGWWHGKHDSYGVLVAKSSERNVDWLTACATLCSSKSRSHGQPCLLHHGLIEMNQEASFGHAVLMFECGLDSFFKDV